MQNLPQHQIRPVGKKEIKKVTAENLILFSSGVLYACNMYPFKNIQNQTG